MEQPRGNQQLLADIRENIGKVMVGKDQAVELVLVSLLAGGHVLIEDVPGLGKTTLVAALAKSLDCTFRRIQFTPDVLPSDVTGFTLYDLKTGEKQVQFGAVMSNIVLADEINRTSPKTQSSLLEVMSEGRVTIDGVTYAAPQPFMVLATQNPVEMTGTYPLPEAQLDRFLMRISLGYPAPQEEREILRRQKGAQPLDGLEPTATGEDVLRLRQAQAAVTCAPPVLDYIVQLAGATRADKRIALGVSPRGSLALMNAAMAYALVQGRDYVLPDDVQKLIEPVLAHRILLETGADVGAESAVSVLRKVVESIPVPAVS